MLFCEKPSYFKVTLECVILGVGISTSIPVLLQAENKDLDVQPDRGKNGYKQTLARINLSQDSEVFVKLHQPS